MDDQAALSHLYPVTSQNQANFSGKQISAQATTRIHGSVFFADAQGNAAQPMQGVNIVARWIDPSTGLPSRTFVATSVSGFLFTGNAGNLATGMNDTSGEPFSRFGSNNSSVEGFFDLAGLQIPNGATTSQYQLSVEAVDPAWSTQVGPYGPWQVQPSGSAQPIIVNVSLGGDVEQNIVMQKSATKVSEPFVSTTFASPAPIPASGEWNGSINGYGDADYFWFAGEANRTLAIQVTALNETNSPSPNKMLPVMGLWNLSDAGTSPAPVDTPSALNISAVGTTQLNASLLQSNNFRLGIFDFRGDGRPDYRYHARIFYADRASPSRIPASGGVATIKGLGFHTNTTATVGSVNSPIVATSTNQLLLNTPPSPDGVRDVVLADASAGMTSTMSGVLTYGAGPNDTMTLISSANPSTAIGAQAPVPITIQVRGPDGSNIAGATVAFSTTPVASLSSCANASTCSVLTDLSGRVSTRITPITTGVTTIFARLAPASYPSPQQVQTVVLGLAATSLDLSLATPKFWVPQGSTVDIPIATHVLSNGSPLIGQLVSYSITAGVGTLSASSAATDNNGNSKTILHAAAIAKEIDGSACAVAAGTTKCQNFAIFPVAFSSLQMQAVAGTSQTISATGTFAPLAVRIMDSANPPDTVFGAAVNFQFLVGRALNNEPILWIANTGITQNPMPVVLATFQTTVLSDTNGLATVQPNADVIEGPVLILGSGSAGNSSLPFVLQSLP
jgi:hypothetical protein